VTDAQGGHRRVALLPVGQLGGAELDGALIRRIGIGNAFSEPVLGRLEAGGRPSGPACTRATGC
jgi:regulator of sigma E protease